MRTLSFSPTAFGVVLGLGMLGSAAGALGAPRLARHIGPGPMMLSALALTPLTQIPLLLASPRRTWETVIGAALVVQLACASAVGTTQRSIRQLITSDAMQARMQAVSTWLTAGSRPLAALLAGVLGTWAGIRPTLLCGTLLLAVPLVVLATTPLRALRHMPSSPSDEFQPAVPPADSPTSVSCRIPEPSPGHDDRHDHRPAGDAP